MNIAGLAIGIACCVLIFQYVAYERSYDSFTEKRIKLSACDWMHTSRENLHGSLQPHTPPSALYVEKDFPEVEDYCRLIDADLLLSNEERNVKFNEEKGYYADPSFLSMFNLQLIKGNPKTALDALWENFALGKNRKEIFWE